MGGTCILLVFRPCTKQFQEKKLQYSVFKFFISILKSYRSYILTNDPNRPENDKEASDLFDKEGFILGFEKDSKVILIYLSHSCQ